MIAATILIVYIEIVHKLILLDIPDYYCPSDPVTKMEAYIDKTNVVQNGLMGCYCQGRTSTLMPWTWFAENFDDIVEELGTKKKDKYRYYCFFWLIKANFKYLFDFVYLGIAVILNGIISKIFKNMDTF